MCHLFLDFFYYSYHEVLLNFIRHFLYLLKSSFDFCPYIYVCDALHLFKHVELILYPWDEKKLIVIHDLLNTISRVIQEIFLVNVCEQHVFLHCYCVENRYSV